MDAVMCEQDGIWADSRYFSEQKMAEPCDPSPSPEPATPEEQEKASRDGKEGDRGVPRACRQDGGSLRCRASRFQDWTSARSAGHKARHSLTDSLHQLFRHYRMRITCHVIGLPVMGDKRGRPLNLIRSG